MVHVDSLQRVQEPANIQARRLVAAMRKFQSNPNKVVYSYMKPTGEAYLHGDSSYRRLTGDTGDDEKGKGMRGANLRRRGNARSGKPLVHLLDTCCKSHRLHVRSSDSAETSAARHQSPVP